MKKLLVLGFIASTLATGLNVKADTPKRETSAHSPRFSVLPLLSEGTSKSTPTQMRSVKTRIGGESVTLKVSHNKKKQLDLWARQLSRLPKSKADAFKKRLVKVSRIESKKQKSMATRKLLTEYGFAKYFSPNGEEPDSEKVTILISWPPYIDIFIQWEA